jgi:hypothetical protein
MHDPRDGQVRYLIHFDDGGSGMRWRDEPLQAGVELHDGGGRYEIERVEQPPNTLSFGHAWARRVGDA